MGSFPHVLAEGQPPDLMGRGSTPWQSQAGLTYICTMTVNESSQTAALINDALQCKTNPPRHILVVADDDVIFSLNTEVLTKSGSHADAAEERVVAWQTRLANNQHRKLRSAEHRLLFDRPSPLG